MPVENIQNLIPQRPPFVMVDKVLSFSETGFSTGFGIRADNIFTENGLFKEPGLVENIAQTAAARAGYVSKAENKPVQVGYIGAVNGLEVFALPKTGDELITEITIENQIFDVTLISGKITCNNEIIAQCKMKIFINKI
ncbi:MAG: 3-hydroxyacyl-ACP dehydratase [Chitinophagaceae bacterium]|nr:3-hydroxyacyl-ACP dehydratase [Chitinophagaceae bacterium]